MQGDAVRHSQGTSSWQSGATAVQLGGGETLLSVQARLALGGREARRAHTGTKHKIGSTVPHGGRPAQHAREGAGRWGREWGQFPQLNTPHARNDTIGSTTQLLHKLVRAPEFERLLVGNKGNFRGTAVAGSSCCHGSGSVVQLSPGRGAALTQGLGEGGAHGLQPGCQACTWGSTWCWMWSAGRAALEARAETWSGAHSASNKTCAPVRLLAAAG